MEGSRQNGPAPSRIPFVHMTLQGKGGVGKSLVSSFIAQNRKHHGLKLLCLDTDPVNRTFHRYRALDVQTLDLLHERQIDPEVFDRLVELILGNPDAEIVIDNGAASFVPLTHYLSNNNVFRILNRHQQRPVVIHTVITGGQACVDTLEGLDTLVNTFPFVPPLHCVVWLNDYFGPIAVAGKPFEQMPAYLNNKQHVASVIRIHSHSDLHNRNIERMAAAHMTFEDIHASSDWSFMAKERMTDIRDEIFEQLDHTLASLTSPKTGKPATTDTPDKTRNTQPQAEETT